MGDYQPSLQSRLLKIPAIAINSSLEFQTYCLRTLAVTTTICAVDIIGLLVVLVIGKKLFLVADKLELLHWAILHVASRAYV